MGRKARQNLQGTGGQLLRQTPTHSHPILTTALQGQLEKPGQGISRQEPGRHHRNLNGGIRTSAAQRRSKQSNHPSRPCMFVFNVQSCNCRYGMDGHKSRHTFFKASGTARTPERGSPKNSLLVPRRRNPPLGSEWGRPWEFDCLRHRYGPQTGRAIVPHMVTGRHKAGTPHSHWQGWQNPSGSAIASRHEYPLQTPASSAFRRVRGLGVLQQKRGEIRQADPWTCRGATSRKHGATERGYDGHTNGASTMARPAANLRMPPFAGSRKHEPGQDSGLAWALIGEDDRAGLCVSKDRQPARRGHKNGHRARGFQKEKGLKTAEKWCPGADLNHRHADFQSAALPPELPGHSHFWGWTRDRFEVNSSTAKALIEEFRGPVQRRRNVLPCLLDFLYPRPKRTDYSS